MNPADAQVPPTDLSGLRTKQAAHLMLPKSMLQGRLELPRERLEVPWFGWAIGACVLLAMVLRC